MKGVFTAWGRILAGYLPALSIEITRECPLNCPGCYAYGDDHLRDGRTLRQLNDLKGDALVHGVIDLVDRHRPLHVSIVGGEPLVRYRELGEILPALSGRGVYVQLVTSAVREIPPAWHGLPRLSIVVSIDGLRPEHDVRRAPATYDRILKHIAGHEITVHCTVTRPQMARPGYLDEFLAFWSARPEVTRIWMSLYTPQIGEVSVERLPQTDRLQAIADLRLLRRRYSKLSLNDETLAVYETPPHSPEACVFARLTTSITADLTTAITPCQFGGKPDCQNCGCLASAGLGAVGRHRLLGVVPIDFVLDRSLRVGAHVRRLREETRSA
jgi:sulfatase maturation enzyme AslB (radical SAM superfamily)